MLLCPWVRQVNPGPALLSAPLGPPTTTPRPLGAPALSSLQAVWCSRTRPRKPTILERANKNGPRAVRGLISRTCRAAQRERWGRVQTPHRHRNNVQTSGPHNHRVRVRGFCCGGGKAQVPSVLGSLETARSQGRGPGLRLPCQSAKPTGARLGRAHTRRHTHTHMGRGVPPAKVLALRRAAAGSSWG